MESLDWLILTAANAPQARGYTAQLEARQQRGQLGPVNRWMVCTDPGGRRIGSGGSTLWVLYQLARRLARPAARRAAGSSLAGLFEGRRVLIIHSGGDSRRLCAYAAQGKVFAPLPCDVPGRMDQPATLFDLILAEMLALKPPSHGHILLCSGDVLLSFEPDEVDLDHPGVVGVAYPGTLERAGRHGVYVPGHHGRVLDFLQKPDEATARHRGAVDDVGRALIDTGIISLDPPTAGKCLQMAGVRWTRRGVSRGRGLLDRIGRGSAGVIDLYEQLLMALPPRRNQASYLDAMRRDHGDGPGVADLRRIHRCLHGTAFRVKVLSGCEFFHIGTSREFRDNITGFNRTAQRFGFTGFDRCVVSPKAAMEGAFAYNSLIFSDAVHAGRGVLIEASHFVKADVELPGDNIIAGYPGHARTALRLPAGWGLVCLPLRGGEWTAVVYGLDDDFKTSLEDGGTFGNMPMGQWLERTGLPSRRIFPRGRPRALWEARLWVTGPIDRVLRQTLWMAQPGKAAQGTSATKPPAGWINAPRLGLSRLLMRIDHDRLITHRRELQRLGELHHLGSRLLARPWMPVAHVLDALTNRAEAAAALQVIARTIDSHADPLVHARLYRLAGEIQKRYPKASSAPGGASRMPADADRRAFASVAAAVEREVPTPERQPRAAILHDQVCWATVPARLDFAGGWSDTPPICTELGGTIVNAAITLNGQYPIQVMAKLTDRPTITLSSIDLGHRIDLTRTPQVHRYQDPTGWAALPLAALVLSGLCPRNPRASLPRHLERFGGGLELTLFSALPKGSGLGTSSILGAAVLACLDRITGRTPGLEPGRNDAEAVRHHPAVDGGASGLVSRTSLLEQMMTTGGGWQDQVGGITPGVKLIRTRPGLDQTPGLHWTVLDPARRGWIREHLLLYYTGQKRMARNILQNVVGRYLARDPQVVGTIDRLKAGAEQMKEALDAGDLTAFAQGIDHYWSLKKQIDPGATNPRLEQLMAGLDRHLLARLLPGLCLNNCATAICPRAFTCMPP